MSMEPALTPPTQALPDGPAPGRTPRLSNMQPEQTSPLTHELKYLLHACTPSIRLHSSTDRDHGASLPVPQGGEVEDEYTLSAYGDISLSEVMVPPLPAPTHLGLGPSQPRPHQPRLRPRVGRPPKPKRRLSYTYVTDSLPHSGGIDPDERWPGSPRPFANNSPWFQHQPLVSPLPADPVTSPTRGGEPVKKGCSSLERLFDELVPCSPSIRLSPPGSPASQALSLPRETHERNSDVRRERDVVKADGSARLPQSSPTPAPRQDKPKEVPWRTRLPPRLPIPKWDM